MPSPKLSKASQNQQTTYLQKRCCTNLYITDTVIWILGLMALLHMLVSTTINDLMMLSTMAL